MAQQDEHLPVEEWAEKMGFKRPENQARVEDEVYLWDDIQRAATILPPKELSRYVMIFLRQALGGWVKNPK